MGLGKKSISIGLPVYNGERYLAETIESILNQDYPDFEFIISDNGSTDSTQQICESFAAQDKRIKYHRNPQNLGAAPNYNKVFELASGEYFKWADYDDVLAPEFLSECIKVLDQHPEVAACYPRATLIDEHGNVVHNLDSSTDTCSVEPHIRFRNFILYPDHYVVQASGLIRADLIRKTVMHGSYSSSDEVFLANLALLGDFYEIPERLMFVRIHAKQSTKGVLASERARVLFFDTSLKGQTVLVKWLYFQGCLTAIRTAPISAYQRLRCYQHLVRWLLVKQNLRSMVKDMLLAIHQRVPLFSQLNQDARNAANQIEV